MCKIFYDNWKERKTQVYIQKNDRIELGWGESSVKQKGTFKYNSTELTEPMRWGKTSL